MTRNRIDRSTEAPPAKAGAAFDYVGLLPLFYWIIGAINAIVALYGFFYIGMAVLFANVPWDEPGYAGTGSASPALVIGVFAGTGVAFILGFGLMAALQVLTGFSIRDRVRLSFCRVVAGGTCLLLPLGTLLGVLTLIALRDPALVGQFTDQPISKTLRRRPPKRM